MAVSLRATNLDFGFGRVRIGGGVGLAIGSGEVLCLLGPNGSGKTTLFKTLLGLLPPLGGRLEIDGIDIARMDRAAFARCVAYVPQAQSAYFPFTVHDLVLMGRASRLGPFASPSSKDRSAATAALERLGIAHLSKRTFTTLSGGERQMVLIARALAQEAETIVMDEPTASLDFGNEARILGQIRDLARSGRTIVLSTHNPGHAFACADRVALMSRGEIVALGPPEEVITSASLEALYGVKVAVAHMEAVGHNVCAPIMVGRHEDERPQYSERKSPRN